jgi:hypothetical protein
MTLAAAEAEIVGDWDEVRFLSTMVMLLPDPSEVAWAAMYLVKANLSVVEPLPDADDAATAGALCASNGFSPAGAPIAASSVLSVAVRSLQGSSRVPAGAIDPTWLDPAPILVSSCGILLTDEASTATSTAAGLYAAVAYAFVRSAMASRTDPLARIHRLMDALP